MGSLGTATGALNFFKSIAGACGAAVFGAILVAEYLLYADGNFAATGGHRTTSSGAVAQSLRVTAGVDHGEESERSGMMRTTVHRLTQ